VRGNYPTGTFRNKLVLVGASVDSGLSDVVAIPRVGLAKPVAGIEVHAAAIDAILHDEIIVHTPAAHADAVANHVRQAADAAARLLFGDFAIDFPLDLRIADDAAKD
jgi:DNA polymerase-1